MGLLKKYLLDGNIINGANGFVKAIVKELENTNNLRSLSRIPGDLSSLEKKILI
jgi:hypothetical protein